MAWNDYRSMANNQVYAQRVNNLGATQWAANGVAVCAGVWDTYMPDIASDMMGGAFITWSDSRLGNQDIYAQRLNAAGAAQWAANGIPICSVANDQYPPRIISDCQTGMISAIIVWEDNRSGNTDIYAQSVDDGGWTMWGANGLPVCTAASGQHEPWLVPDGMGGAVFVWTDWRGGSADIYAQHIDIYGIAQWTANGEPICTAANTQYMPKGIRTTAGNYIFTWHDERNMGVTDADIYAQMVDPAGVGQWSLDGEPVCDATGFQYEAQITTDGAGGAHIAWSDERAMPAPAHIYAQRMGSNGRWGFKPQIIDIEDVPKDQGGKVTVTWEATDADHPDVQQITHYSIWRSLSAQQTAALLAGGHESVTPGEFATSADGPIYRFIEMGSTTYGWEWLANQNAHYLGTYTYTAETLYDSIGTNTGYHHFFVSAHMADPFLFWDSDPDSGYSVDNFSPGVPTSLAGYQEGVTGIRLEWDPNTEHRGGSVSLRRVPRDRRGLRSRTG
jgi:hypothetical protein